MILKVLHDWDSGTLSGRKVLRRGISLVTYAISRWFPVLNRIKWIRLNNEALEGERLAHMEVLILLDRLLGIDPIFGLTVEVMWKYNAEIAALESKYDLDIREHYHIGSPPDPNRIRGWVPPLNQSMKSWNFETDFIAGHGELEPGDLPIFHVDHTENLGYYIRYLSERLGDTAHARKE